MDKKAVINYLWKLHKGVFNVEDALVVVEDYCMEHAKDREQYVELFVETVLMTGLLVPLCRYVLDKHKREHHIITVYRNINDKSIITIY